MICFFEDFSAIFHTNMWTTQLEISLPEEYKFSKFEKLLCKFWMSNHCISLITIYVYLYAYQKFVSNEK